MKLSDILHYCKLHVKAIGILAAIIFVFILIAITKSKSTEIQKLLLKLQMIKVTNDVATIQHTINTNTATISGLDASNATQMALITSTVNANITAQATIESHNETLSQLAQTYNSLN